MDGRTVGARRYRDDAAIVDEAGNMLSRRHRFRTVVAELDAFWAQIPTNASEVLVVMEPTRDARVPFVASKCDSATMPEIDPTLSLPSTSSTCKT